MPSGFPDVGSGLRSTRSISAQIFCCSSGSRMDDITVERKNKSKKGIALDPLVSDINSHQPARAQLDKVLYSAETPLPTIHQAKV